MLYALPHTPFPRNSSLEDTPLLPPLVASLAGIRGRLWGGGRQRYRRGAARGRGLYSGEPMLGPFVAGVGGFDVPFVRLEGITAAADAHFREVPDGVLSFW